MEIEAFLPSRVLHNKHGTISIHVLYDLIKKTDLREVETELDAQIQS